MGCAGFQVFQCSGGEGPAENLLLKVSVLCLALSSAFWRMRQEDKKAKKKEKGEERK